MLKKYLLITVLLLSPMIKSNSMDELNKKILQLDTRVTKLEKKLSQKKQMKMNKKTECPTSCKCDPCECKDCKGNCGNK